MASEKKVEEENSGEYITLTAEFEDFSGKEIRIVRRFKKPTKSQISRCNKTVQKDTVRGFNNFSLELVHPGEKDRLATEIGLYCGLGTSFSEEIYKRCGFGSMGK